METLPVWLLWLVWSRKDDDDALLGLQGLWEKV